MDPLDGHSAQPHIVGLIFDGHEQETDALDELLAEQGDDAHVEEDAGEDGDGHNFDERSQEHRAADQHMGQHRGETLLPGKE